MRDPVALLDLGVELSLAPTGKLANTRPRAIASVNSSISASGVGKPMRPSTNNPAGDGSTNSARNTIELGRTGPPM